jgi:SPW repeat-containing protein
MATDRATQRPVMARHRPAPRRADPALPEPGGAPTRRARGWREAVMGLSGLNVLAGIWLIISPWVLGYGSGDAWWNPVVCGAIVTILAFVRAAGDVRADGAAIVNMLVGIWLFVSAWWLASSSQASWNVWILGLVVFFLALFSLAASRERAAPA